MTLYAKTVKFTICSVYFSFRSGLKSVALFVFFQNNKNRKLSPTAVISRLRDTSLSLSATAKFYELREYRHGDSLRNVHWKLSSKSDGLIVKEPNVPIIKNCLIMPFFGDNADENDVVFAKLMYVCRYMIKSIGICFACDRNGNPFEIRCENDILNYFSALYLNTESSFVADTNDFQHYSIFADREEVDLL